MQLYYRLLGLDSSCKLRIKNSQSGKKTGKSLLIFFHGFLASHNSWNQVVDYLDLDKNVILLFDLPGFGNSPKPTTGFSYTLKEICNVVYKNLVSILNIVDFNELKLQKNINKVKFIGFSSGGTVVVHLIELYKDVSKVTDELLIVSPLIFSTKEKQKKAMVNEVGTLKYYFYVPILFHVIWFFTIPTLKIFPCLFPRQMPINLKRDFTKSNLFVFKNFLTNVMLNTSTKKLLTKISTPTTLLYTQGDQLVESRFYKKLATLNSRISLKELKNLNSHHIPLKYPNEIANML